MDNFCPICGLGDEHHDCLTELLRQFKRMSVGSFLAAEHTEEEYIIMRQKLKPLVEKIDKLRIQRQLESIKFKRLEGEAEKKLTSIETDLNAVTMKLLKVLED